MMAANHGPRSLLLAPLLVRWQQLAQSLYPETAVIVRINSGSAYITQARLAHIDTVVSKLLGLCLPYLLQTNLLQTDLSVSDTLLRHKLTLEINRPNAGLLLRLRYYGDPPTLDHAAWVRQELADTALLLDAASRDTTITLGVLMPESQRRLSLIYVRAADQHMALPMAAVLKAVPTREDVVHETPAQPRKLAACLGLRESRPASHPAWLLVKTEREILPLQVDALEGHGQASVLSPGPLFLAQPCYLGFIPGDSGEPIAVIDPLALLL